MSTPKNPIRDEYLSHIKSQQSSGLSIKKYCKANNLVPHKFAYYQSYILEKDPKEPRSTNFSMVKVSLPKKDSAKSLEQDLSTRLSLIDPIWLGKFVNSLLESK